MNNPKPKIVVFSATAAIVAGALAGLATSPHHQNADLILTGDSIPETPITTGQPATTGSSLDIETPAPVKGPIEVDFGYRPEVIAGSENWLMDTAPVREFGTWDVQLVTRTPSWPYEELPVALFPHTEEKLQHLYLLQWDISTLGFVPFTVPESGVDIGRYEEFDTISLEKSYLDYLISNTREFYYGVDFDFLENNPIPTTSILEDIVKFVFIADYGDHQTFPFTLEVKPEQEYWDYPTVATIKQFEPWTGKGTVSAIFDAYPDEFVLLSIDIINDLSDSVPVDSSNFDVIAAADDKTEIVLHEDYLRQLFKENQEWHTGVIFKYGEGSPGPLTRTK